MQKLNFRNIVHLHRRKALIFFLPLFFLPAWCSAQLNYLESLNKKIYFGITLGYNSSRFKIVQSEEFINNDTVQVIRSKQGPGFNLGIISNLILHKYFDLRFVPSLSFAGKELRYTMLGDSVKTKDIESISIEFPLSIRFKSMPIKDIRIYVLAGMKYSIDLASNAKARRAEDQVKVSRHDLSYELGLGIQFYFPLFIFSPEIKIAHGVFNLHSRDSGLIYSSVIDKLFSRAFIISLHFEG